MSPLDLDYVVSKIHKTYQSLSFVPPHSQYTILASFFLFNEETGQDKILSISTGTKCIPAARLSSRGELVHDSHAEVLARRGALRWFLEERIRMANIGTFASLGKSIYESPWIFQNQTSGKIRLRDRITLHLYVSTLPCGDASMRCLASIQDKEIAALKNSTAFPELDPTIASRGRDNYCRLGVLRTKPGRADSPPTLCMSCSDKITLWNVVGIQGALGALVFDPIYISIIVVGDCDIISAAKDDTKGDCERAFWRRLEGHTFEGLPSGYHLSKPQIQFSHLPFVHSKSILNSSSSCNDSLSWIADAEPQTPDVLINGLKRGVSSKHRYNEKLRTKICRLSLYQLCAKASTSLQDPQLQYCEAKALSIDYQTAKQILTEKGPFAGWIKTGSAYQQFNRLGIAKNE